MRPLPFQRFRRGDVAVRGATWAQKDTYLYTMFFHFIRSCPWGGARGSNGWTREISTNLLLRILEKMLNCYVDFVMINFFFNSFSFLCLHNESTF